ncbi:MAG TPA: hypothetical protein VN944_07125 [Nitrospiria bacterium]|nr:hypothetical protein [Nitrospiria bacterium]
MTAGKYRSGKDRRGIGRRSGDRRKEEERRQGERRTEICPTCSGILNAKGYCYGCKVRVVKVR